MINDLWLTKSSDVNHIGEIVAYKIVQMHLMPDLYHIFVLMITCFVLCYLSVVVNIAECDSMWMRVHVLV